jgi:hypothetical protein
MGFDGSVGKTRQTANIPSDAAQELPGQGACMVADCRLALGLGRRTKITYPSLKLASGGPDHGFANKLAKKVPSGAEMMAKKKAGRKDVRTTIIYTHVLNRGGRGVESPLDRL